jgi:hypothetical protein
VFDHFLAQMASFGDNGDTGLPTSNVVDARFYTDYTVNTVAGDQYNTLGRYRWSAPSTSTVETGINMTSPRNCADGWTVFVHPDGWRYFYSPGVIVDDLELSQQPPTNDTFKRELEGDDYEEYFMLSADGNQIEKGYINHTLGYASSFKERVHCSDRPSAQAGECHTNPIGTVGYLNPFHLHKVNDLRIGYLSFMVKHPSHRCLNDRAEEAVEQSLHVFMMGKSLNDFLISAVLSKFEFTEGLRRRSDSRAPFSVEECRELLDYLGKRPFFRHSFTDSNASPFTSVFMESTARTHLLSWILLHASTYFKFSSLHSH